jgi:hypothetical protein
VVLVHDGGGPRDQTVAALAKLIPQLITDGWTFDLPATTVSAHPLTSPSAHPQESTPASPKPSGEPANPGKTTPVPDLSGFPARPSKSPQAPE